MFIIGAAGGGASTRQQIGVGADAKYGLLLALVAQAIFLSGVYYGLPQPFDSDEQIFVRAAAGMLSEKTLDPGWYGAPAQSLIYLLALVFGLISFVGIAIGAYSGTADIVHAFKDDPTLFYVAGRVLSASFMTACVVMVYVIARSIGMRRRWCVFAAILAIAAPLISDYAWRIRMDAMQALFNLLGTWFCIRAMTSSRPHRMLLAAGVCLGLAVTAKFTGVAGVAPILLATLFLVLEKRFSGPQALAALSAAGVASLISAFLSGPYLFINMEEMLVAVAFEARPTHLSATGGGFSRQLGYYLFTAIPDNLGVVASLAALAGAIALLRRRQTAIVVAFPLAYLLFISLLSLQWERWLIPVIPFATLAAAWFLYCADRLVCQYIGGRVARAALSILAVALALLPIASVTAREVHARAVNHDTRTRALVWAQTTLPAGTPLLLESRTIAPSRDQFDILVVHGDRVGPWYRTSNRPSGYFGNHADRWNPDAGTSAFLQAVRASGAQYVVLGPWMYRYQAEADDYPREVEIYAALTDAFPEVIRFEPEGGELGPPVRILRVTRPTESIP